MRSNKEALALLGSRDQEIAALKRHIVERALTEQLAIAGVQKQLIKGAAALLSSHAAVVVISDQCRVTVEDGDLEMFVSRWITTSEGAEFCKRPISTHPDELNPFSRTHWNKTHQGTLQKNDRMRAAQLASAAGFKSLEEANRASRPQK